MNKLDEQKLKAELFSEHNDGWTRQLAKKELEKLRPQNIGDIYNEYDTGAIVKDGIVIRHPINMDEK